MVNINLTNYSTGLAAKKPLLTREFKRYTKKRVSMKLTGLILMMGLFSFKNAFASGSEETFWKWFQKNENMLFYFESDQERIFNELASQMNKINGDLTFEFGPIETTGKREFVISAGGIKSSFPFVESLYSTAPTLKNWVFIKYRPRRNPLNDLEYGGVSVSVDEVYYKMFKDNEKVGIIVFINGYNEQQKDIYGNIGYLFLDEALGEYDIETQVGFIEFHGRESKYYEGAFPLKDLANDFDAYLGR